MVTPFSVIKNYYDSDASAFCSNMSDMSHIGQQAVHRLVAYLKVKSIWTKLKYAIICPDTMDETQALRDLKNNVVYGSGILYANENCVTNTPMGYSFQNETSLGNSIDSGRTLSAMGVSTTSCCIIWGEKRDFADANTYSWGSNNSATQRMYARIKSGSISQITAFRDSSSLYVTNTDARGLYVVNKNALNYYELVKDGSLIQVITDTQAATLPTPTVTIGSYNGGSYCPGVRDFWAVFDGLTIAERDFAITAFNQYRIDMNRFGNYTKSIVLDGNSLTIKGADRMLRKSLYNLGLNNYNSHCIGIAGQTTADMNTRYSTYAASKYDSSLSKNIYIALEIGNDLYKAFITVAQAKTNMINLIASAKATGFTAVCMVPSARTYVGTTSGRSETQFNLDMDTMVQWVRAGSSGADYIVDLTNVNLWLDRSSYASDALYNTAIAGIVGNTSYFIDGTHMTASGYDIRGTDLANKLRTIL